MVDVPIEAAVEVLVDNNNDDEAPPANNSSKKWKNMQHVLIQFVFCAVCIMLMLWIALFVIVALLLSYANTPAVRNSCAGFWDFMLVSMLSPVIIPVLYCLLSCCAWPWRPFSGACMLIMGGACLHLTITCSENVACMEAIRKTTPPLPWLIYMGWLKASLYFSGAVSSFVTWYSDQQKSKNHHPTTRHYAAEEDDFVY